MLSVDSVIVKLYDSNHQVDNYLNGRKMNLVNDLKSGVVTLNQLKTELGISVKEYPDAVPPRIVLNYCQIESPKSHPYVMQSRGLILNSENFDIMCLPFDRFFNFGEVYDHSSVIDFSKAECREKIDGSLIKIYHDGYKWCIATRGTAFAESTVGGYPLTFKDLVLKALGFETDEEFQLKCMSTAASLPDLQEGYVLYQDGTPICKIKSPAYVAVHHIRGEGLSPKRISELVLSNEQDEYLKYFPEDEQYITPYSIALSGLISDMNLLWLQVEHIEDQKEFALKVKDSLCFAALFQWKKKGGDIVDIWNSQPLNYRRKLLLSVVGEKDE